MMLTPAPSSSNAGWNEWLASFFPFVNDNNDVVRAVSYINDGNSRIDLNVDVLKNGFEE
jgi:hypothetical protein